MDKRERIGYDEWFAKLQTFADKQNVTLDKSNKAWRFCYEEGDSPFEAWCESARV